MDSERRHAPRYPFIAEAVVTEISSDTKLIAKTGDLSIGGCFLDMLNPTPQGTQARVRISHASAGGLRVKVGEPCFSSRQRRFFLAEGETDLISPVTRIIVKAGTRNGGHADFFDQIFRERDVLRSRGETNRVRIGKARNVRHDVIRAARLEHRETGVLQNFQQPRALLRIASRKFVVVTLWR